MLKRLTTGLAIPLQLLPLAMAGVGDVADFSGLDAVEFYQNRVTAEELRGKVVMIEYWGVMCRPCRAVMPELQALYEVHKDRGFVLLAVQCQNAEEKDIRRYLDKKEFTFPVCARFILPQAPVAPRVPYSVLIGPDGTVLAEGLPRKIIPQVEEAVQVTIDK